MSIYYRSYSHLNIPLLRREIRKYEREIAMLNETIRSHKKEVVLLQNKRNSRKYMYQINHYNWAIDELEKNKKRFEDIIEAMQIELERKKKRRFSNIKFGACAISIVIAGFVLNSGDGSIQRQENISVVAEKDDDDNIDSRKQIIYYQPSSIQKQMSDSDKKSISEMTLGEIFENVGEGIENFFEPYIESQRELQEELSKSTK